MMCNLEGIRRPILIYIIIRYWMSFNVQIRRDAVGGARTCPPIDQGETIETESDTTLLAFQRLF